MSIRVALTTAPPPPALRSPLLLNSALRALRYVPLTAMLGVAALAAAVILLSSDGTEALAATRQVLADLQIREPSQLAIVGDAIKYSVAALSACFGALMIVTALRCAMRAVADDAGRIRTRFGLLYILPASLLSGLWYLAVLAIVALLAAVALWTAAALLFSVVGDGVGSQLAAVQPVLRRLYSRVQDYTALYQAERLTLPPDFVASADPVVDEISNALEAYPGCPRYCADLSGLGDIMYGDTCVCEIGRLSTAAASARTLYGHLKRVLIGLAVGVAGGTLLQVAATAYLALSLIHI